ncbi:hypothetical protein [Agrobacterium tumefaciens]|uniref:hypothetical protein n=1 Tax=Agrobacterium tumefaciens TaxID=358 RepID=UPI001574C323|nr:hypothetical protein [Agrobacterium tumefaciens]NTE33752.1 hypothetical protein [Agrobacterium tumefaciens]NTE49262.1 hypothetical protein [Agrobacterium tumefaciens]
MTQTLEPSPSPNELPKKPDFEWIFWVLPIVVFAVIAYLGELKWAFIIGGGIAAMLFVYFKFIKRK